MQSMWSPVARAPEKLDMQSMPLRLSVVRCGAWCRRRLLHKLLLITRKLRWRSSLSKWQVRVGENERLAGPRSASPARQSIGPRVTIRRLKVLTLTLLYRWVTAMIPVLRSVRPARTPKQYGLLSSMSLLGPSSRCTSRLTFRTAPVAATTRLIGVLTLKAVSPICNVRCSGRQLLAMLHLFTCRVEVCSALCIVPSSLLVGS